MPRTIEHPALQPLKQRFPDTGFLVGEFRDMVTADPSIIGTTQTVTFLAHGDLDSAFKGQIDLSVAENNRKISDKQVGWMNQLAESGALAKHFNTGLFVNGASSRPEAAGVGVAVVGSLYMMLIVLVLSLPIGVAASIYLEEFAPKNRFTDLIEVNINNLAAVPSIVYGLLGLAVFVNFAGFPRSAALVGGLPVGPPGRTHRCGRLHPRNRFEPGPDRGPRAR